MLRKQPLRQAHHAIALSSVALLVQYSPILTPHIYCPYGDEIFQGQLLHSATTLSTLGLTGVEHAVRSDALRGGERRA